ncbi:MAG: aldose epimerase family protein [Gemmatimonadales bacterium]
MDEFQLTNSHGTVVRAITLGAAIRTVETADRAGRPGDIVLGFDDLAGYRSSSAYVGAVVGRYANRIANGRFTLDGVDHQLARNNGPNALHGGVVGFDQVVWNAEPIRTDDGPGVAFRHRSPDGTEGYPGTLEVRVSYVLTESNRLLIDYHAATDRATPVNLTQHTFFNLTGDASRDITGHILEIDADRYTPVDPTLIPLGTLDSVAGTPFDFRRPTAIGARIGAPNEQLRRGAGYDHNFVVNGPAGILRRAARVVEPERGRTLEVWTTEPGLHLYTGNFLDGRLRGKNGRPYQHRWGLCLETQHFPDSPNRPEFPSTILRPGEVLTSRTVFAFGIDR